MQKYQLIQLLLKNFSLTSNDVFSKYENKFFNGNDYSKIRFFEDVEFNKLQNKNEDYIIKKCASLKHHMDRRSPLDYGLDLLYGWIIEDIIEKLLINKGFDVFISSADADREFLPSKLIKASSDFHISKKTVEREVEILVDWKETWSRYNHLDLRDNKYLNLKEQNALLLGVAPQSNNFLLIDLSKPNLPFEKNFIKAYRKYGYSIMDVEKHLMNFNQVILELDKLFS